MKKSDRQTFFDRLRKKNPQPASDLVYHDPFTLLVAVALSAQATDAGVNRATATLFAVARTPQDMLDLGVDGIKRHIKTIGLFNAKASNLYALSRILVDRYQGAVPRTRDALESLPGIGRKTANVVLNIAFGEPTIAVDTHVFRVSNRTGLASGKTVRAVEDALMKNVPREFMDHAHHWLILHGRYVCKARNPSCATCIVNDLCPKRGIKKRPAV